MKSAINVCGVSRSMMSVLAAALFIGASALPSQATIPNNATGTGTGEWSVTDSPGWKLGDTDCTDTGTYYLAYVLSPWGINATVRKTDTVKSQNGTVTCVQHFTWTGDPGAIGSLTFALTARASAYYAADGQTAHGHSNILVQAGNIPLNYPVDAKATETDTPVGFSNSSNYTSINPQSTDFTSTATTQADVSTP